MNDRDLSQGVTVVIPTYNRIEWLKDSLESVMSQTVSAEEIIVVDDGSTDETLSFLENFEVTVVHQQNQGPSAARNVGARMAKTKWLAFLDSDDRWFPNKLECQLNYLDKNPDVELVYTGERWIRNGVRVNACKHHKKYSGWIYPECLKLCLISPSSVMLSKNLFDRSGGFNEKLWAAEDYDLWLKITSKVPVGYLEEELIVKYGGHEGQLSNQRGIDVYRVVALENMMNDFDLKEEWKELTRKDLCRRSKILMKGFNKHGNPEKAMLSENLRKKYLLEGEV